MVGAAAEERPGMGVELALPYPVVRGLVALAGEPVDVVLVGVDLVGDATSEAAGMAPPKLGAFIFSLRLLGLSAMMSFTVLRITCAKLNGVWKRAFFYFG